MRFQKKQYVPWSGELQKGPSLSGREAMHSGLLPIQDLVRWLRPRLRAAGIVGTITAKRVRCAVDEQEKHHWKDSRGIRLVPFFDPEKAFKEILILGNEYF